jgi:glycosyltransferase involved in cell wall biosynthesis
LCNLIRYIQQEQVDHVHGYFMNLPGVVAMLAARSTGRPFTLAGHARDVFVDAGPLRLMIGSAKGVVACNQDAAIHLRERAGTRLASKVHLIPHGIDTQQWLYDVEADFGEEDVPRIAAAGRFVEKKGFRFLLEACHLLRERGCAFRLILAGDGPERTTLEAVLRRRDLFDCVEMPGWLSEERLRRTFRQARLLAVPSVKAADGDRDGLPNVVLEAAACGLPCVASELPGLISFVRHGETGLLVDPRSSTALASAVERLLTNGELRDDLGRQARLEIESRFDLSQNVDQLIALFREAHEVRRTS